MASMARSGETLILKILNEHSKVHIVHNLDQNDSQQEQEFFHFLKSYKPHKISVFNKHVKKLQNMSSKKLFLIKQGVWKHNYEFKGFVLVRNPIAIYASLKKIGIEEEGEENLGWLAIMEKIKRWGSDMDKSFSEKFDQLPQVPPEQFVFFYNLRMNQLINYNKLIVYYERFVDQPQKELDRILGELNLNNEAGLLDSHLKYKVGHIGHGNNDFSRAIDNKSLEKYKYIITQDEFDKIKSGTKNICSKLGYNLNWNEITLQNKGLNSI